MLGDRFKVGVLQRVYMPAETLFHQLQNSSGLTNPALPIFLFFSFLFLMRCSGSFGPGTSASAGSTSSSQYLVVSFSSGGRQLVLGGSDTFFTPDISSYLQWVPSCPWKRVQTSFSTWRVGHFLISTPSLQVPLLKSMPNSSVLPQVLERSLCQHHLIAVSVSPISVTGLICLAFSSLFDYFSFLGSFLSYSSACVCWLPLSSGRCASAQYSWPWSPFLLSLLARSHCSFVVMQGPVPC